MFGKEVDSALYKKLRRPTVWILLGIVLSWGIPDLQFKVEVSFVLFFIAKLLISLAAVLLAMRVIDVVAGIMEEKASATEGRMDDQLVPILVKMMRMFVGVLGLIFVLQNLGVNVSALVAGLGVGGIAIALAAKDTLANVFGSITIFTDQPFHVGDLVDIDGVIGSVEEVGLRSTRVRTPSGSVMTIPNARVANSKIDNIGAREYRRSRGVLGLSYSTAPADLTAFVEGFREILAASKDVVTEKTEVHFTDFGASSLDVMFSFYLDVPGWHDELVVRSEINMAIMDLAAKLSVSFAFPSQSLYIESMPKR
jgi:MscS family membrane protein